STVADGTGNEQQRVAVNATGGTFSIAYGVMSAQTAVAFDLSNLQAKLDALLGAGNTKVLRTAAAPNASAEVYFTKQLAGTDLANLIVNSTGLTGGTSTASVTPVSNGFGSEVQRITVPLLANAPASTFTLTYLGITTGAQTI